jgi:hypothetical protein
MASEHAGQTLTPEYQDQDWPLKIGVRIDLTAR